MRRTESAIVSLTIVALLSISSWSRAVEAQTGPREGDRLGTFQVRDCTGPAAGKTLCYVCRYGARPMVVIFTRRVADDLGQLAARLDRLIARHRDQRLAAVIVYVGRDTADTEKSLKQLAESHRLAFTPLSIYKDTAVRLSERLRISADDTLVAAFCREGMIRKVLSFDAAQIGSETTEAIADEVERLLDIPTRAAPGRR